LINKWNSLVVALKIRVYLLKWSKNCYVPLWDLNSTWVYFLYISPFICSKWTATYSAQVEQELRKNRKNCEKHMMTQVLRKNRKKGEAYTYTILEPCETSYDCIWRRYRSQVMICGTNVFVSWIPFVLSRKVWIVLSPLVPWDETNGIFLNSELSRRTLNNTVDHTLNITKQTEKRQNASERDIQWKVRRALWLQVTMVFFFWRNRCVIKIHCL
jgi:hypothetical protein